MVCSKPFTGAFKLTDLEIIYQGVISHRDILCWIAFSIQLFYFPTLLVAFLHLKWFSLQIYQITWYHFNIIFSISKYYTSANK